MSKLSKLIKNPYLFFKDMAYNFANITSSGIKTPTSTFVMSKELNDDRVPLVLYSGEPLCAGVTHLKPWISVFIKANVNFVVLVRNISLYRDLVDRYPSLQVVYAKTAIDIETFLKIRSSIRYVFYSSNTGNNVHIIRWNCIDHIFIGHGDSDKASSAHKGLRLYDEIWVSGQAHIDRFANSGFNSGHIKFVKVGRPNLQNVLSCYQRLRSNKIEKILYLPTWEGGFEDSNYSSMRLSEKMIFLITNHFSLELLVKFHPLSGMRNRDLQKQVRRIEEVVALDNVRVTVASPATEVAEMIRDANVFICDVSAVISECLTGNGPIFVYIPLDRKLSVSLSNMPISSYCYTFSSILELQEKLAQVLSGNDYLFEQRQKAMNYFIGYEETVTNKFIDELQRREKECCRGYLARR